MRPWGASAARGREAGVETLVRDLESTGPLPPERVVVENGAASPVAPAWPSRGLPRGLWHTLEGKHWSQLRLACDTLMLSAASIGAVVVGPAPDSARLLVLYPPLTLLLLAARGRYRRRLREVLLDSVAPGFGAISIGTMTIFMLALFGGGQREEISLLIAHVWVASLVLVTAAGMGLTFAHYVARKRRKVFSPTLIVGSDEGGVEIARQLERHPEYGLKPVGFLAAVPARLPAGVPPLLGEIDDLPAVAEEHGIRHVIVGFPEASASELLKLTERCDSLGMEITVVPRLVAAITRQTHVEYLGTIPLLNLREIDLSGWQFAAKHAIDRALAVLALTVVSPLMLVIAIAVRLSSPGPILFSQPRAGRDGQVFPLLKFRTMLVSEGETFDLPEGLAPGGVEGTDRRTRVGRLLRRTSLDELPQLINVLRGEMSVVGPRPERPEYAELFRRDVERYHERHRVKAGITGWAQVHGMRGQTPVSDRVELDNYYIEHWSLGLDMRILLLTVPALFKGS